MLVLNPTAKAAKQSTVISFMGEDAAEQEASKILHRIRLIPRRDHVETLPTLQHETCHHR